MVPSEFLETFQKKWNEMLNREEGGKIKKLLATNGKTLWGNGNRHSERELPMEIEEAARAARGHYVAESCYWHLDVTFREDGKHTLEKQASYHLNILRKLALNILKMAEIGNKALSVKKKRYAIGTNPEKYLERIIEL